VGSAPGGLRGLPLRQGLVDFGGSRSIETHFWVLDLDVVAISSDLGPPLSKQSPLGSVPAAALGGLNEVCL
jgi:hypothetical protein